jgi:hypothetical protein
MDWVDKNPISFRLKQIKTEKQKEKGIPTR